MANSKISELGGVRQDSRGGEMILPALGDGTAKAGHLVGILATGKVVQCGSAGTDDEFMGILLPNYAYDMDTAIADSKPCSVLVPQTGKLYGCFCVDPGAAIKQGEPFKIGSTDGSLEKCSNIEDYHIARSMVCANGDTVGIFIWGDA